jgi:hypothetical protein
MRQDDPNYPFVLEQLAADLIESLKQAISLINVLAAKLDSMTADLIAAESLINEVSTAINMERQELARLRKEARITPEGIDLNKVTDSWATQGFLMYGIEMKTDDKSEDENG